jgi:signal transduction histidine kinase
LLIATLALPLACLMGLAFASQVTQPLGKLKHQVQRIAEGEIFKLPPTDRNDEIRDLNQAINEMAARLEDHDEQLRQNERLRTMIQFGSGIAHHLRNSATGCQLAIELLANEHPGIAGTENYQVAIRQIGLMNNYIKKFLLFSKSPGSDPVDERRDIELDKLLERLVFLLRPSARHLGVAITVAADCERPVAKMAEEDAEQLVMNLISNAITAASSIGCQAGPDCDDAKDDGSSGNETTLRTPHVAVELFRNPEGDLTFRVTDNGPGPPAEIAQDLFQPFVTGSREGTGLGLALVREIAERVHGTIDWRRSDDKTIFTFKFGRLPAYTGDMQ